MAASSEPAPKATKLPGKYSLNKTLSDPISPFLKAAGYSWATRKAADAVGLTLTIEIRENSLFGHGSTWLGDADYQLSFSETSNYALIGDDAIAFDSEVSEDGAVHSRGVLPNDSSLRVHMVHAASDGGGLIVSTTITDSKGEDVVSINRVLDACP